MIDAQFVSRALADGARCVRGARSVTEALYPRDGPDVITTAYYEYNRTFEALAMVEGALAHVIRSAETVTLRLAAADLETVDRAERRLREQLPERRSASPDEVPIEFSYLGQLGGIALTARTMSVPALDEVEMNYPGVARAELTRLAGSSPHSLHGRLLLWHGPPGCGRTWALRAIASEWRDWCTVRYVSDPEILLKDSGYLVNLMHMRPTGERDDERWRLIVLEDTGELLAADAKREAGQSLSRLLNVVDGLLGESSKALS